MSTPKKAQRFSAFRWTVKLALLGAAGGSAYFWFERFSGGPHRQSKHLLRQYYYNSKDDKFDEKKASPTHGQYDFAVIGGGILGVTVAAELRRRFPNRSVALVDKEPYVAVHQSSHNSGVIHAGIYDPSDSLKTTLCTKGNKMMYEYCNKHKLPVKRCGKLVVAVTEDEIPKLKEVFDKAKANGAEGVRLIEGEEEIKKMEPNVKGVMAMHCPSTGIVDFAEVTRHVFKGLQNDKKFTFIPRFQVQAIGTMPGHTVEDTRVSVLGTEPGQCGPQKLLEARNVITCAGLHMDTISRLAGGAHHPTIVPFRGRYYELKGAGKNVVKMNVYPVPNTGGIPTGVHWTPTVNVDRGEQLIIGPGAAFAPHKEGYSLDKISIPDFANVLFSGASWTFLFSNFGIAAEAIHQDMSRAAFIADARKLVPNFDEKDVVESYAGVMAQAFGKDGKPLRDFTFEATHAPDIRSNPNKVKSTAPNVFNVRHAPSPAATSSFALAEEIVTQAKTTFAI